MEYQPYNNLLAYHSKNTINLATPSVKCIDFQKLELAQ